MTRREFIGGAAALLTMPLGTDARIEEIRTEFKDFLYRAPYKFGGREVDRVTLLNVHCRLRTRAGKSAEGFGSMPMGNVWSFPAPDIGYDTTLAAMKSIALKSAELTRSFSEYAHPLDVNRALLPEYLQASADVSREMKLPQPIPKLCVLVTTSPIDAAIHDAFGKLHGRDSFAVCGKEFVRHDLGYYLNSEFNGEYLDRYILPRPRPRVRMYHSVGASDPLTASDVKKRIDDGLPETLEEWIPYSGVTAIKIKLNGNDLEWDVNRVATIDQVAGRAQAQRGLREWLYSLDFNERCPNERYLLDFERQLKSRADMAFARVQYIEQPTARDLAKDQQNTMFEAAKLKPVVIDESLTGLDTLLLAREMGYTGVALKACKGQSETLLLAAAAQKYKMFRCVQDLTCPGAALIHSAAIAAHVPRVSALEANAREYVPVANSGWTKRFPGIFDVRNGFLDTSELNPVGLGAG
ncbi:MAG: mandelate racemase/muconate lactonizing enzyme family protein [Acidobacteriaceae bacterium]|nr:mandelate racemase/muconate lactonizing enzyme family protein [Acidobacteriaceae bacterium]